MSLLLAYRDSHASQSSDRAGLGRTGRSWRAVSPAIAEAQRFIRHAAEITVINALSA